MCKVECGSRELKRERKYCISSIRMEFGGNKGVDRAKSGMEVGKKGRKVTKKE